MATIQGHDAFAGWRSSNYRRYALGFFGSALGLHMQATEVLWHVYERTNDEFMLGLTGLARALPVVLLALFAGHVADVLDRKRIVVVAHAGYALLAALLALVSWLGLSVHWIFGVLALTACARAFAGPARNGLLPLLVPSATFQNVVTWNSVLFHAAAVAGPLLAGWLHERAGPGGVFLLSSLGMLSFSVAAAGLRPADMPRAPRSFSPRAILAGASHLWRERTIFAAITLDLFAVLLGGATAMLPVYARDILHLDARGHGLLRAMPYLGAFLMGLYLARRPNFSRAGPMLLLGVAGFGIATIVFGLSRVAWLSAGALLLAGASDNISVVIRHVLVQLRTPNELRGRVGAVNSMFIECSNELGAFESGLVARLAGPVFSVVSGGVGTLLVVIGVAAWIPEIRRLRRIEELPPESGARPGSNPTPEGANPENRPSDLKLR